jgi:dTDP-4-dehydrorhamnose 3,5-epimerase-like enzyme
MKFKRTDLHDVVIIEPTVLGDERSHFRKHLDMTN